MELKCLKCGSDKAVKNGFIFGQQRYKCKKCGYQYTKTRPHGHSDHEKRTVALLYMSGLSMSSIARIVGVSVQTVSRWIRTFYTEKADDLPKMDTMKKVTLKQVLQYFQEMSKEEQEYEVFLLSTRMPSGCGVKVFVDNPLSSKNKKSVRDSLMSKLFPDS